MLIFLANNLAESTFMFIFVADKKGGAYENKQNYG